MASWTPEHLAPETLPNAKCPWATTEEERQEREMFGEAHLQTLRTLLVALLHKPGRSPTRAGPKACGTS